MDFIQAPTLHTDTSSAFRIFVLVIIHIIAAIWIKRILAPLPLGTARVLAAVPVFVVQTVGPWCFDKDKEPLQLFCSIFMLTWLGSFKVLALCWGRAPLRESMSVAQITAALILPLFPKPASRNKSGPEGRIQDSAGNGAALVARWAGKTGLVVIVVLSYMEYREVIPVVLKHYLLAFTIYSMSGIIMDGPAAIVVELLDLPLVPTFDQPWMSASLSEFWGRRWNIPTTSVLRTMLYDTCAEGSLINPARLQSAHGKITSSQDAVQRVQQSLAAKGKGNRASAAVTPPSVLLHRPHEPSLLRRQLGLNLAFFVSGLFHEYMAWLLTGSKVSWKWTLFFWIQAPLMTLEAVCSKRLRRAGVQVPRPLAILLTHLVLQGLAYDLFFGYMEEQGIALKIVGSISKCIWGVVRPLSQIAVGLLRTYQR